MSKSELCWALNEKLIGSVALNIRLSIRKIRQKHTRAAMLNKMLVRRGRQEGTNFRLHRNT